MARLFALVAAALWAGAGAFHLAAPGAARDVAAFGRNDRRTRRGKLFKHSTGVYRPKLHNVEKVVDPYATLRDWGSRQEPPMTVEEAVEFKMAEKKKVDISPEILLATLQLQHKG